MMNYIFAHIKRRPQLLVAVIALVISAIYGQFLWNPIVFDDNNFFGGRIYPEYLDWKVFFSLGSRWLPYATFEWTRVLLGHEMIWYRLGNMVLHIATSAALFLFLRRLFEIVLPMDKAGVIAPVSENSLSPFWLAFFGALIFALHPAAVYAVGYLIQRTTLMATFFAVVMWWLFVEGLARRSHWWLIGSAGAYFFAVLSKEHAIMAPAVALAIFFLVHKPARESFKQVWPTFLLYGLIGANTLFQMKSGNILGQAYEPRGADMLATLARRDAGFNPAFAYPLSVLTQSFLFFKYLLVWIVPSPAWMSVDMFEQFAARLWSWPHVAGLVGFVIYPAVAIRLLLQRGKRGLLGFAMLCPWLMFATELSAVRIQESFVLYRSYLWLPGACAAMPFLFQKASAKRVAVILTALALVMIPATWDRLRTFSSALLLWDDAARLITDKDNRPGVERIYHNRGLQFSKLGYFEPALADFNKAIALNPNYMLAYNDRGATYLSTRQFPQALHDFDKAIELNPKFARSYLGRALAYEGLNNSHAALLNYQQLCALGFTDGCVKLKPVLN